MAFARLVLRTIDISAGSGWSPGDYPTPFMAGSGNYLHVDIPVEIAMNSNRRLYQNLDIEIPSGFLDKVPSGIDALPPDYDGPEGLPRDCAAVHPA